MEKISLKHIETFTGIKAHTIRAWEQRYNFFKSKRTQTNRRIFTRGDLDHILNICFLNKKGHKLCELDQLSREEIKQLVDQYILDPQQQTFQNLLIATIAMEFLDFEKIIDEQIHGMPFDQVIFLYIWPYISKIQQMISTNLITARHEHLFQEIIKRKLYSQIESSPSQPSPTAQKALLYCIEGEHQDLKLLCIQYMLLQQGIEVYYLGSSLPNAEISCLSHKIQPDLIFIHAGAGLEKSKKLIANLQEVEKYYPNSQIYLTGDLGKNLRLDNNRDIMSIITSEDVKNILEIIAN